MWKKLQPYRNSIILLIVLIGGAVFGVLVPNIALQLKPIGKIFLNLLFMIIVPLVGISVMSAIAKMSDFKKLGKLLGLILLVSVLMAIIPGVGMIGLASVFDLAQGVTIDLTKEFTGSKEKMDFVSMFTTNDFVGLLSKSNILALVIMSILSGIAISQAGEKGKPIVLFLNSANEIVMNIVGLIMKLAPVGLGAFFAATMAEQDITILDAFANAVLMFFLFSIVYFIIGSTVYSYIGGGIPTVKAFWKNIAAPSITALGTCSSLGTLPVTIRAAKKMEIKEDIADICLPLLVNLNKGGVSISVALKVVFIYSVLGIPFTFDVFMTTMVIAILSAVIVSGVPGGAFLGEIFIVTTLGLPLETIPMLVIIGTITDAPATMINVVHDLSATQIVERFISKKSQSAQQEPIKQII